MNKPGLKELSEHRYRIVLEESRAHELPDVRNPDRLYYEKISCKGGASIGLYAKNATIILQLYPSRVKNARIVWEQIKDCSGVSSDFHMDGEAHIYTPLRTIRHNENRGILANAQGEGWG